MFANVSIQRIPDKGPDRLWGRVSLCLKHVLALFCLSGTLCALEPDRAITQYVRESWTTREGAPAGTITAIAQTPDGYLWLGTRGQGLVRFDGINFVHADDLDAAFNRKVDRVTSMICGRDGTLWVGTNQGLGRFRDGRWRILDAAEGREVYGLHETAQGKVWYARHWEGLYEIQGDVVILHPLSHKPRFVTSDSRGVMWAGGYEGLWRLDGKNQKLFETRDGLPDRNINAVHGDALGNLWVGTQVGLTQFQSDRRMAHFSKKNGLQGEDIRAIYLDKSRVLWMGSADAGLIRRHGQRFEHLDKAMGLSNNKVTALFEDREGSLWIGTAGGLNRLRDATFLPLGESEGLSRQDAVSLVADAAGRPVIGTGFGGLNIVEDGQVRVVSPRSAPHLGYDGPLFGDADGSIWSGHRDGINCWKGSTVRSYPVKGQITCIDRDRRSLLFGTGTGEVYRLIAGKPERYRLADGSPLGREGLGFDYVWSMHMAKDGTLWLGTSGGAYAVRNGQVRRVWGGDQRPSARAILEDEEGTIWLGTMAGLVRITKDSVVTLTPKEGLPQNDIIQVQSDGRGSLWMGGSRGIFQADRRQIEAVALGRAKVFPVTAYGVADGTRTAEAAATYEPASCVSKDGRIWFTTAAGAVSVNPMRIIRNNLIPPVVVEGVIADDKPLTLDHEIQVSAGVQRLAIQYNGLSLLVPSKVQFKYKLQGYDHDWIDGANHRVAYYTKLPPGRYVFKVKAANNDGVWNETGASIHIRKRPWFYQTWWFLGLVGVAVAASAYGFHRMRVLQHVRTEQDLKLRVTEALANIKTLQGLLPICAWCKKIRDDQGYWNQLEEYIGERTQAEFSHGICPECQQKLLENPEEIL